MEDSNDQISDLMHQFFEDLRKGISEVIDRVFDNLKKEHQGDRKEAAEAIHLSIDKTSFQQEPDVFDEMPETMARSVYSNYLRTLVVTVHDTSYPVTTEVLQQIFDGYGLVEDINILPTGENFQALVRYKFIGNSLAAMYSLHNRCIYEGCCWLDIKRLSYTMLEEMLGKYNSIERIHLEITGKLKLMYAAVDNIEFPRQLETPPITNPLPSTILHGSSSDMGVFHSRKCSDEVGGHEFLIKTVDQAISKPSIEKGKTLLTKTLTRFVNIPCVIADETTLTHACYVGEDAEYGIDKTPTLIITQMLSEWSEKENEGLIMDEQSEVISISETDIKSEDRLYHLKGIDSFHCDYHGGNSTFAIDPGGNQVVEGEMKAIKLIVGKTMATAVHPTMETIRKTKSPTKERRVVVTDCNLGAEHVEHPFDPGGGNLHFGLPFFLKPIKLYRSQSPFIWKSGEWNELRKDEFISDDSRFDILQSAYDGKNAFNAVVLPTREFQNYYLKGGYTTIKPQLKWEEKETKFTTDAVVQGGDGTKNAFYTYAKWPNPRILSSLRDEFEKLASGYLERIIILFHKTFDFYSRANNIEPGVPSVLSNRGAAYLWLSQFIKQGPLFASEYNPLSGSDPTTNSGLALEDASKETLWKGDYSETQMAKSFCAGQFVKRESNVINPRSEWPQKKR